MIGPPHALNLVKERAIVASSGSDSIQSPSLAIDGKSTPCALFTGAGKTWLRVDIQTVRYIREVRLLFKNGAADATIFVGRGLKNNGASDNEKCGTFSNDVTSSHWKNVSCMEPNLGQFIYIESPSQSMRICEIQVFYGNAVLLYCCSGYL